MTKITARLNTPGADGVFAFAFTSGLWLYYATGRFSRRDPSSASSYPASPGAAHR